MWRKFLLWFSAGLVTGVTGSAVYIRMTQHVHVVIEQPGLTLLPGLGEPLQKDYVPQGHILQLPSSASTDAETHDTPPPTRH